MPEAEHDGSGRPLECDHRSGPGRQPDEPIEGEALDPSDLDDDVDELIDAAEARFDNPVAAWEAIEANLKRRIARHREWAPSGAGDPTREGFEQGRPRQSTGGAMSFHAGVPTQARRPFVGFDVEVETYARLKPELLPRFEGKFVVIVGDEIEGPVDTFSDALRAGYRRFGLGPLFVKQILATEPVVEVTRDIVPCRS
jgi:hypothetical protein